MDKIILVGGGQASAWAAYTLRSNGYTGTVSVVSDETYTFYERPPLSKVYLLEDNSTVESLSFFPQDVLEGLNIDWYLNNEVSEINSDHKTVMLKSQQVLSYDALLLATGSQARIPVEAWKAMARVHTLRTILDSQKLKKRLTANSRLAVIGGGWIGLEVAATASQKNITVSIFELASRLCQRNAPVELSECLKQLHEAAGSQIFLGCEMIRLVEKKDHSIEIYDGDKLLMVADLVLVGAGAKLNTDLAHHIGLTMQNGAIKVNDKCQTSDKFIYAAGDVAIHPDLGFSLQSYQHAQKQGIVAAKNMLGIEASYTDTPWFWSDQFDYNIQLLGVLPQEALECVPRVSGERQKSYFYFTADGKLQFLVAMNDPRSVRAAKKWMQDNAVLSKKEVGNPEMNLLTLKY